MAIGPPELTVLKTLDVPALPSEAPVVLARANETHKRVLVSNLGPTVVLVATDVQQLATQTPSDVFMILAGQERVLPLSPSQTFYAASVAAGGQVTVCVSPAIPLGSEWMRS